MGLLDRLSHAWNAFIGNDPISFNNPYGKYIDIGPSSSYRPDRIVLRKSSEKSVVGAIYNRIAVECSSIDIRHVRLDDNNRFKEIILSDLNECLTLEANKDQTAKMLIRDIVLSMFDEGVVAVCPIDTTINPKKSSSYDIQSLRVAKILQWYPDYIQVEVYTIVPETRNN